jgi:hypothetical protein
MNTTSSNSKGVQDRLLRDILHDVQSIPDTPVREITRGPYHILARSDHAGLCARTLDPAPGNNKDRIEDDLSGFKGSVREFVKGFFRSVYESRDAISCALAAINSILPVPEKALPMKAQHLIERHGKGKNAAFIGHFPFVEKLGPDFHHIWVLERDPRPGDLDAEWAGDILPRADVVGITATTLLNGTCAGLLRLIPDKAFTIMLGPSTPFAPCLFDWGIDALAGCRVNDVARLRTSVQAGGRHKGLKGTEPFTWVADR